MIGPQHTESVHCSIEYLHPEHLERIHAMRQGNQVIIHLPAVGNLSGPLGYLQPVLGHNEIGSILSMWEAPCSGIPTKATELAGRYLGQIGSRRTKTYW